jgi:ribosomal protein S27E
MKIKCPKCQSPAIFYEDRRIPYREGFTYLAIGRISCAACGKETLGFEEINPQEGKSNTEER